MGESNSVLLDSYERELVVHLDDAEVNVRAQEAADQQAERDRIEDERLANSKEMAGQVKALDSSIRTRLRQVRLRQDVQGVGVEKHLRTDSRTIVEVRTDTGELISERPAREDELQLHILPYAGKRDGDEESETG